MRGCPAINRHKNKLQLPSMNKFHCNLLCIPFFPLPLAPHVPPATTAFAAWVTTQKAFEILVYKSQPKRSCLFVCARSGWGSCWSSGWGSVGVWSWGWGLGYLVSVFTLFLSFTRSLCGSPMLCCCLLFEFIVYTIQTVGGGVAVQYTNCLCVCVCVRCSLQSLSI